MEATLMMLSNPNYLPEAPLPNTDINLGIKFITHELSGDILKL
jgi:hypothetical protein